MSVSYDPMDCSLPGASVHGIFQAIVLEWIAISFSRGSSQPRDQTRVSRIVDRHFTIWATREVIKVGSQETPGVTGKFGLGIRDEAGQRLIEFCQENALVIADTLFQQHKRRVYTWTSPDGQHWNQTDYTLCSQRWRSSIESARSWLWLRSWTPYCQIQT